MTKLKLQPIGSEDKRAGKYQVTLDPLLNADLQLYIEAYHSAYPAAEAAKPEKIIAAMVQQFIHGSPDGPIPLRQSSRDYLDDLLDMD